MAADGCPTATTVRSRDGFSSPRRVRTAMAADSTNRGLETATRELLATLRELEDAVEPPDARRFVKPPTPRGFLEFTSEVGIPAAILVLRTNVAALELLQRTLRMATDRNDARSSDDGGSGTAVRERATTLTATSLSRLDDALADLQTAIDGRSIDRSPEELLAEARQRTEELEAQLSDTAGARTGDVDDELGRRGATEVDVEAELQSLRESVDRTDAGGEGDDGTGTGDVTGSGDGVGDGDGTDGSGDSTPSSPDA